MLFKGLWEKYITFNTLENTKHDTSPSNVVQQAKDICINQLLIPFEAYAKKLPNGDCKAYPDPATGDAPWTIGFGSTYHIDGTPVKPDEVWTREYAVRVKSAVLDKFIAGVLKLCPNLIHEHPNKLAAITSFAYNVGLGNLKISNLRKKINSKDYQEVPYELSKWNKANSKVMRGLTRRRKAEAEVFMSNDTI